MVEVHNSPDKALSDGFQALTLNQFDELMRKLTTLLSALDRPLEANIS